MLCVSLLALEDAQEQYATGAAAARRQKRATDGLLESIELAVQVAWRTDELKSAKSAVTVGIGPARISRVGDLMQLAVANPKTFCRLYVAAFLRPPTKLQRGRAARRAWEQRERAGASGDGGRH